MATINVRQLLSVMQISAEELADRLGVHERTVDRWLYDKISPSPMAIHRLREVYHEHKLRRGSGSPSPTTSAHGIFGKHDEQTPTDNALTGAVVDKKRSSP